MAYRILILGASYGSLLGTKLLMAGHDVTLVCRQATADLIGAQGTEVRIKLRDEASHRAFRSTELPGRLDAMPPEKVDVDGYDFVALAMSEPQCCDEAIAGLLSRIALAGLPCLSIMNMPPLPYLRRIDGLDARRLQASYTCPQVWADFEPGAVSLCSPDPQAFRIPGEGANLLHVGLPTNFKAAPFAKVGHNRILRQLAADVDAVRIAGRDVPVKLRALDSLFVPFAKWSMLMAGNYRCILPSGSRPIKDAVHGDPEASRQLYERVAAIVGRLGAAEADNVPFEKYATAANGLLKPSSAARAIDGGAKQIERVDMLVKLIADQVAAPIAEIEAIVATVDARLAANRAAAGSQARAPDRSGGANP